MATTTIPAGPPSRTGPHPWVRCLPRNRRIGPPRAARAAPEPDRVVELLRVVVRDIAMLGWVRGLVGFYEAGPLVGYDALRNVPAWLERGLALPKRG